MGDGRSKTPIRRCAGCGQMIPKPGLIRVVHTNSEVSVDLTNKKPGRGVYVCRNGECLSKAEKNRGFERSFKKAVPKAIYEQLKSVLEEDETDG